MESIKSSGQENETNFDNDQIQVATMLRALELLSHLAAADSPSSYSAASQQLDDLLNKFRLSDTHVLPLRDSIERLQSNCHLLQEEADAHSEQMHKLNHELYDNSIRIHKLEKALQKIHAKNKRLKQKAEQNKKSLVSQVKNYVIKKNQDEQRHQLFAHERLLKLEGSSSRSRCSSRDTDFTDADMVALQSPNGESDELSMISSCESSVSTTPSFVTDEGIATVRYSPAPSMEDERSNDDYNLTFPQGATIGLQFQKMTLDTIRQRGLLDDAIGETDAPSDTTTTSKESPPFLLQVCGHYGFDQEPRPPLGARLVKVNGDTAEELSLDKIKTAFESIKHNSLSLSFREEVLDPKRSESLDKAIKVVAELNERRSENCSGEEKREEPVIISLCHQEGSRFSSFLHSTRRRTYSDTSVGVDVSSDRVVAGKDVTVSPSTKPFYSILHGGVGLEAVEASSVPRLESSSHRVEETPTKSRAASMFNSVRNRALSSNSPARIENEIGKDEADPEEMATPPSGRGLYAILHGSSRQETPKCDRECSGDAVESDTSNAGIRLSSLFNSNTRNRAQSDSDVREPLQAEETDTAKGTPEGRVGSRLSSLIHSARSHTDSGLVCEVNVTDSNELDGGSPGKRGIKKGIESFGTKLKKWNAPSSLAS